METKLPKEFKEKWIAALRSGEYKQGTGRLFISTEQSYCCIGVAGKLCGATENYMANMCLFDNSDPDPLFYTVKPPDRFPSLLCKTRIASELAAMNDGIYTAKQSFPEIADWIEANL